MEGLWPRVVKVIIVDCLQLVGITWGFEEEEYMSSVYLSSPQPPGKRDQPMKYVLKKFYQGTSIGARLCGNQSDLQSQTAG